MAVAEPSAARGLLPAPAGPVVVRLFRADAFALAEVLTDLLEGAPPEDRPTRGALVALLVQIRAELRGER